MNKLVYFVIPAFIILTGMLLSNCQETAQAHDMRYLSEHLRVVSAEPPEHFQFAGEKVPLENFDVLERLDKELQRYVYFHSSTILLIKRSKRYREVFLKILEENQIPKDFFYMAVAESALSNATSPAGAKGFWQFMKSTAKAYDLEISETVDERYHPEKATKAACNYLNDSYKRFGNWALVAASYNMGTGGISKAMKRQQVDNYYDLHLNRETSKYLFRIMAYKLLIENPDSYGFFVTEKSKYMPVPYYVVRVSEDIPDLVAFAKSNGSTYRMLKVMNPWLISDKLTVSEEKTYKIRFPLTPNIYADEMLAEKIPVEPDTLSTDSVHLQETQDTVVRKDTLREG